MAKRANAGRPFFVINYGCRSGNILVYIQRPRRKTAASARQKQTGFGGGWRLVENSPCRPLNYAGHTSNVLVAVDIHCLLFSTSSASSFPSYFLPLSISLSLSRFEFRSRNFSQLKSSSHAKQHGNGTFAIRASRFEKKKTKNRRIHSVVYFQHGMTR